MLTARLLTPLAPRLITLFLATTALLVAAISLGTVPTVEACPVSPPQPLRTLYTGSERIVVARAGESAVVQVSVEDDYKQTLICTTLDVSSTLKGEGEEPLLYVYHWMWGEDTDISGAFKEGDKLLLFLERREEGHGYQVNNQEYGVKKLSDDELKIYVKRIEELAEIMRQEKPDNAQIVEWLLRCAEEPATRWDGVYELYSSYEALLAAKADESSSDNGGGDPKAGTVDGNAVAEQATEVLYTASGFKQTDDDLARLLTDEQKNRLATILFSTQSFSYTEYLLTEMVKDWDDARLVPFLLSHLRKQTGDASYYMDFMVKTVAERIHSEGVSELAEKYCGGDEAEEADESTNDESASDDDGGAESARLDAAAMKQDKILQSFIALAESSLID